jgi:hypothetical protein
MLTITNYLSDLVQIKTAYNKALERTGHTTGFFPGVMSVECGPPLTAGVRPLNGGQRETPH